MRLLYTFLLSLLTPLVVLRLWLKSLQLPAYRQRIGERFSFVPVPSKSIAVWVHAVSVGESLAALPLIEALIAQHGVGRIWVTTTTPTGSERIIAALGNRVMHSYAPYDLPTIVARFLKRVAPQQVVVMETELWPNLFHALKQRSIPLTIANARLSPRSFKGYGRVAGFTRSVLSAVTTVAAQSTLDAQRFIKLGAPRVQAIGNLKFDLSPPMQPAPLAQQLQSWLKDRPVWIAASTHAGEEEIVLAAHQQLLVQMPNSVLILVPRHPQRFDTVEALICRKGLTVARRTELASQADMSPQVLLGNSMGEMWAYLVAAQCAFVGGSLVPVGGHNVLEPASLAMPVLFGQYMHNFLAARDLLIACNAAIEVREDDLAVVLVTLLQAPQRRHSMGAAGRAAVAANRGALQRLLGMLA